MKRSSSLKATIASKRRLMSRRPRPSSEPFKYTFSRPVRSGWKPAPSSSSAATRPLTSTRPADGSTIRATSLRAVLFPVPFGPTSPTAVPGATSNETSSSATRTSRSAAAVRRKTRTNASWKLRGRSWAMTNDFVTPSKRIAPLIVPFLAARFVIAAQRTVPLHGASIGPRIEPSKPLRCGPRYTSSPNRPDRRANAQ